MEHCELFSVVIPTYNRLNYLRQCLASVLNQDYPNIEIIILDNHSTDGTQAYLEDIIQKHAHIKHVRYEKNIGGIKTYEKVPKYINGKYLLMLADDDCISATFCSNAVASFHKNPSVVVWVSESDMFFRENAYDSNDQNLIKLKHKRIGVMKGETCIKNAFKGRVNLMFCSVVYLVVPFCAAGGVSAGSLSGDFAATLSTASYGDVYFFPEVLAHIRVHNNNTSNNLNSGKPLLEFERAILAYRQIQKNCGNKYKNNALYWIVKVCMAKVVKNKNMLDVLKLIKILSREFDGYLVFLCVLTQLPKAFLRCILGQNFKTRLRLLMKKLDNMAW